MNADHLLRRSALARDVRARAASLERFAQWEAQHPSMYSPSTAVELIGALYELLPTHDRNPPHETAGIHRMQLLLASLSRR